MADSFLADRLGPGIERGPRSRRPGAPERNVHDRAHDNAPGSGENDAEPGSRCGGHGPASPHRQTPGGPAACIRAVHAAWRRS
ncbi:hypothetical protein [Kitasatospora sp. NPDC088134]|uniref:hypothetical protein n=1 Tax=Kitasatospora sp. NPDC088134 TaxID=3364071 RepID=UPI00382B11AE